MKRSSRQPYASISPEELDLLLTRLEEAESTLNAIRCGDVDALVIKGPRGDRVFTLKSADHTYRTLVETMNEGAAILSPDGTVVYCNPRFTQLLEITTGNVIGRRLADFFPQDNSADSDDLLRHGIRAPWHCETKLRNASGKLIPVLLSASPALVDDVVSISLIATDLTEQKKNEEIIASERLARSILEQAAEAIVVCDATGRIIRVNDAARTLSPLATVGTGFVDAFPLMVDSSQGFSLDQVLRGQRVSGLEAKLHSRDRELIVLLSGGALRNADNHEIGAVVTLTDITDLKRHQEELSQQAAALARSNADLERFAFAASHDLQEPLRMITTYTQLLTRRHRRAVPDDSEAEVFARFVEAGALRMSTLIRDLLSYSRVIHAPKIEFTATNMNEVLAAVLIDLQQTVNDSRAVITYDHLPTVKGDASQLSQVLQNLITNAIKYCDKCPPQVHISGSLEQGICKFLVRDNGIGIASKYIDQIFGLFKRLHGKDIPGNGIGLAVTKRIIELHGGTIWVESVPGDGSVFYFTVPVS